MIVPQSLPESLPPPTVESRQRDKGQCQRCQRTRKLKSFDGGTSLCSRCAKEMGLKQPAKPKPPRPAKPPRAPKPPRPKRRHTFHSKIRGVSEVNQDGSDRQAIIRRCRVGEPLSLRREPWNRHDANAIAVFSSEGLQLGYIGSELAGDLAPLLDAGTFVEVSISDITGGGTWLSPQLRGVNIEISYYS